MIQRTSRPMTPEERAACDPVPMRAKNRAADLRSAWHWGRMAMTLLAAGIIVYVLIARGAMSPWWLGLSLPLGLLGVVFMAVCVDRIKAAVTCRDVAPFQEAFERNRVDTWTFTIDRVWWNLADEDCDGRLMRTTDGRYVFLGTYEWLDIPMGEDESRPMCPSRLRVVDDGVNFSLTALEGPMIPLEEVPDELPREAYDLPHFEVVVYNADSLPAWLRRLVEPGVQ